MTTTIPTTLLGTNTDRVTLLWGLKLESNDCLSKTLVPLTRLGWLATVRKTSMPSHLIYGTVDGKRVWRKRKHAHSHIQKNRLPYWTNSPQEIVELSQTLIHHQQSTQLDNWYFPERNSHGTGSPDFRLWVDYSPLLGSERKKIWPRVSQTGPSTSELTNRNDNPPSSSGSSHLDGSDLRIPITRESFSGVGPGQTEIKSKKEKSEKRY